MSFRASQIYVSMETRRHLRLIAKGLGLENADEAGERLLSETITERYPALVAHQKQINEMESAVLATFTPNLSKEATKL